MQQVRLQQNCLCGGDQNSYRCLRLGVAAVASKGRTLPPGLAIELDSSITGAVRISLVLEPKGRMPNARGGEA
jgi:hypothetical protein